MEECKAALCAEIKDKLKFDGSNLAFSPNFNAEAQAELDRLCSGLCDTCPVLKVAKTMSEERRKAAAAS